ncbi:MAG: hypothetical protein AB7F32_08305 [Victivallaceae bacterium]
MDNALIPFGYYLVLKTHTKDMPPCCPQEYFSIAGCLCEGLIPDSDNISPSEFDSERFGARWRITPECARELCRFNHGPEAHINYYLLNYMSFEVARQVKQTFFAGRNDVLLIGVGVLDSDLLAIPDLRYTSPLPGNGTFLGFDLYEIGDAMPESEDRKKPDYATLHTYGLGCTIACCDPNGEIPKRLGIRMTRFGFYPSAEDAVRAADLVNREHLGEPLWHLPLALIEYQA